MAVCRICRAAYSSGQSADIGGVRPVNVSGHADRGDRDSLGRSSATTRSMKIADRASPRCLRGRLSTAIFPSAGPMSTSIRSEARGRRRGLIRARRALWPTDGYPDRRLFRRRASSNRPGTEALMREGHEDWSRCRRAGCRSTRRAPEDSRRHIEIAFDIAREFDGRHRYACRPRPTIQWHEPWRSWPN